MKSGLRVIIVKSGKDSIANQIDQIKEQVLSWKDITEQVDDIAILIVDV